MGRKCSVDGCLSDSNRVEDQGVTFHKVPIHNDIRPKWISLCRIPEDKQSSKVIYICSRHFLRVDFCNFKGKKYMLRQGVLPSVFPWDKSKLEAIKINSKAVDEETSEKVMVKEEEINSEVKIEENDVKVETDEIDESATTTNSDVKETVIEAKPTENISNVFEVKPIIDEKAFDVIDSTNLAGGIKRHCDVDEKDNEDDKEKVIATSKNGLMQFSINARIEVLDNDNFWYPAQIVEIDFEENEVLIHFENFSNKYDEWICMDSPRLRPIQPAVDTSQPPKLYEQYEIGERCLALWSDAKKFLATITKCLSNDTYEVLFDDGYVKALNVSRISKYNKPKQASSLFDPVQGTKAERRERKRRLNVAELFGKKSKFDDEKPFKLYEKPIKQEPAITTTVTTPVEKVGEDNIEIWYPQWEDGKPIGKESSFNAADGKRKSIVVEDPRLPKGWVKHLAQRINGASAGKWETFIINPESRRFRSKSEVINYLRDNNITNYHIGMFDFSLHRYRSGIKKREVVEQTVIPIQEEVKPEIEPKKEEPESKNLLKIPIINNAYQCPIEGCGKTYRKENLAQMHVKHYHPEYTKFLDSTPNVADLAYARTVGESLDKSPERKPLLKPMHPKTDVKSSADIEMKTSSTLSNKSKDSEIIKLLGTKPTDLRKDLDDIKTFSSGLPPKEYPDIKLKDLLRPTNHHHYDDLSLGPIAKTPSGIKTLLPVTRPESTIYESESSQNKFDDAVARAKANLKRKRASESIVHVPEDPVDPELNNVIMEGGQLIRIVRMKQEEIINCTCRYTEEDGLMIQCDLCLCWQHAFCNNIERESQVPEKYVCWICQNPLRQRASKKYFHDQDWLKHGILPTTSFHTKDQELLSARFEKLKKSHDISGGLVELADYVHNLKIKLKIAEAKNHPKLYLWSKAWEKNSFVEKKSGDVTESTVENGKTSKNNNNEIQVGQGESMLMAYLKKNDSEQDSLSLPNIPQPEAPIESGLCRLNLLEHISHSQNLVEERLDEFEKLIDGLDDKVLIEENEMYPRTRQTLNLIVKDLETLQEFSQLSSL